MFGFTLTRPGCRVEDSAEEKGAGTAWREAAALAQRHGGSSGGDKKQLDVKAGSVLRKDLQVSLMDWMGQWQKERSRA